MIELDLLNSTLKEIEEENLNELLEKIHARKQGFYYTIDDEPVVEKINEFAEKNSDFEHIVVCGIGGSALGAICLQQSLGHLYRNKLFVLDNIDPVMIKELEEVIDYSKTLFIVITKSGGTVETLSQYDYFSKKIKENGYELSDHMVVVTGPQSNPLRDEAEKEDLVIFDVPENVGGRFSVLTAVGLLPAKLIGIDIEKLLKGAKVGRDNFLSPDSAINLPFQLAKTQFDLNQKGITMNVLMPYAQKLIKFADWWRQLLAESIGKERKGITPINALGVTDQHSQLQLYNDGPNDKLIIFLEIKNLGAEIAIDSPYKTTFGELLQIEKNATASSLTKNGRPNITISVDSVSEEALGQLFLLFEGATAFLGELMGINAFDQPGVELSKKLTKEALLK
ncbi:MAG: glucose-6-phosphate isomerase [Nitrospirae bacterium]|nr:glucose-6-phosphate isomerase [Nitrospirota bacterium]